MCKPSAGDDLDARPRRRTGCVSICARILGMPADKVRAVYLDGAGCYGMNGHDDAAVEAALLSIAHQLAGARAVDARGRARLGPEEAAATPGSSSATLDAVRPHRLVAHRDVDPAQPPPNLACIPLLCPLAARLAQPHGHVHRADRRRTAIRPTRREASSIVVRLAERLAAAAVEHPRARQGRRTALRSRASWMSWRRSARRGSGRIPARRCLAQPRGLEVVRRGSEADAAGSHAVACAGRTALSRVVAESATSTTSTTRPSRPSAMQVRDDHEHRRDRVQPGRLRACLNQRPPRFSSASGSGAVVGAQHPVSPG